LKHFFYSVKGSTPPSKF